MRFDFQRRKQPMLSEQQPKVQNAEVPFPLYSSVHVKDDVSAQEYSGKETIQLLRYIYIYEI